MADAQFRDGLAQVLLTIADRAGRAPNEPDPNEPDLEES